MTRSRQWQRVAKPLAPEEKAAITTACERLITEALKPRFLPEIRPTTFNYPVDIFGKWHGDKYSFIVRFRSGFPDDTGEEFDAPFTRLERCADNQPETRFDICWRRHTGQWWRQHSSVTLGEALRLIETDGALWPPV